MAASRAAPGPGGGADPASPVGKANFREEGARIGHVVLALRRPPPGGGRCTSRSWPLRGRAARATDSPIGSPSKAARAVQVPRRVGRWRLLPPPSPYLRATTCLRPSRGEGAVGRL